MSNSSYIKTASEYWGSNGKVTTNSTYRGSFGVASDASITANVANQWSAIAAKACQYVGTPDPKGNSYVAIFVDQKRGNACKSLKQCLKVHNLICIFFCFHSFLCLAFVHCLFKHSSSIRISLEF